MTTAAEMYAARDAREWEAFIRHVRSVLGDDPWVSRDLVERLDPSKLPAEVRERIALRDPAGASKSLGKMMANRKKQPIGELIIEGSKSRNNKPIKWCIRTLDELLEATP